MCYTERACRAAARRSTAGSRPAHVEAAGKIHGRRAFRSNRFVLRYPVHPERWAERYGSQMCIRDSAKTMAQLTDPVEAHDILQKAVEEALIELSNPDVTLAEPEKEPEDEQEE